MTRQSITVLVLALASLAGRGHAQSSSPNVTLTGVIQGANGLPASNTLITLTPTQTFFVQGSGTPPPGGGCSPTALIGTLLASDGAGGCEGVPWDYNRTTPGTMTGNTGLDIEAPTGQGITLFTSDPTSAGNINIGAGPGGSSSVAQVDISADGALTMGTNNGNVSVEAGNGHSTASLNLQADQNMNLTASNGNVSIQTVEGGDVSIGALAGGNVFINPDATLFLQTGTSGHINVESPDITNGNNLCVDSSGNMTTGGCTGGSSGVTTINGTPGAFTFSFSSGAGSCSGTTCTFTGSGSGGGSVTNFVASAGSWPTWLVPSVASSTTTPTLSVTAGAIPNSALATQTANTVLGALTATTPSGLAMPSCSGATNALIWTPGTGFGCNTITGGSSAFNAITSGTNTTAAMVVGAGASLNFASSGTINASSVGGVALSGLCQTSGTGCPQLAITKASVTHQWLNSYTSTTGTFTATQPAFTDISGQATNAQLATQTANTVLGALTATTPSGLAMPSCSGASNALTWTTGTGFGCNTISGGGGTAWSALTNPTTNLALTMAANTTVFTYNAATSTADMMKWTDTTGNTGTGTLGHFTTASGSTAIPWCADANGVGWCVNPDGSLSSIGTSGVAGVMQLGAGTAPGSAPTSTIQVYAPATVTAYSMVLPGAQPTAASQFLTCTNANPSVCSFATTGGGSGTVTSIATTGPIGGGTITTSGTITCTTCVVATSPSAGIAHFAGGTQTVTSSLVSLASDVTAQLPIAAVGSAGLSGTTPIAIASSGAISCATCLVGSSLAAGVVHAPGSSQTMSSSLIVAADITAATITGAKMVNNTITATQLALQYSKGSCTEAWGGSGTSFALTSGDDGISNNTCYNDSGVTRTITAVKCRSSIASNTTTVNPTFGSAGTGTTILSGALTCGSSFAYSSTGTVTNASWTTGSGITPAMGGTLTGVSIAMIVEYTF